MKNLLVLIAGLMMAGCADLPSGKHDPRDPWERFNRTTFKFNDALDRAVLRPVARGYVKVTHDITEKVRAQRSLETLSNAGMALASSLDESTLLAQFARVVLEDLADFVLIDLFDEQGGAISKLAAHQKTERAERLREVRASHPLAPSTTRFALDRSGSVRFLRNVERELSVHPELDAADRVADAVLATITHKDAA